MDSSKVKHVVVDSCAFIGDAPIREIGENVYTTREVIQESSGRQTRHKMQVLPYELLLKEPTPEAVTYVTEFSKMSGDYRSLSSVDLKVMAVTYDLEKEHNGTEHIRTAPDKKVSMEVVRGPLEKSSAIVGFYAENKKSSKSRSVSEDNGPSELSAGLDSMQMADDYTPVAEDNTPVAYERTPVVNDNTPAADDKKPVAIDQTHVAEDNTPVADDNTPVAEDKSQSILKEGDTLFGKSLTEEENESDDDTDEEDDEDDGGWITPQNIHAAKEAGCDERLADIAVACVTTDFAMQNVLIQMGLHVVSVDGKLIQRAKSYVLRCHTCFKVTTKMEKIFCPNCGNKSLDKITMTVNDDGSIKYYLSRKRRVCQRLHKTAIPAPKGGKHPNNPVLFEDQRLPQQKPSRASKVRVDVLSADFLAGTSPFAVKDVHSRAAQLGITARARHSNNRNRNAFNMKRNK